MSKVSSSNGLEKYPKLRFPGFVEPWKVLELSSILKERNEFAEKDGSFEHATLSKDGIFGKTARYDRDFLVSTENKKYKVTHINDLCYNPANLKFGVICLNKYGDAIFSPIYVTFEIQSDYDADFVGENLSRWDFINKALRYQQGTVYERMAVSPEDFLTVKCYMPSKREQEKLSKFIGLIDEKIVCQRKYIDVLKKYKRGLSDELFGENETTEEWTTVPFGEAFDLLQNNTFSRDEMSSESGIAYNIHYGDVLIKYGVVVDLSKSKVPYIRSDVSLSKYAQSSYLRDGDIVIADTAEDYTVGKAVEIVGVADVKALSGLHTIPCRPKISFAPMYLGYFINSKRFRTQILPLVQGTKVSSINKSEILKTSIAFPSFGVQSQIATMLYALDHRIDICQACVQGLARTKEALLQQLFI